MNRRPLLECIRLMLRPVARFCLRHSITIQDVVEMAKAAFIEEAERRLSGRGEGVNVSRLSVMSGIHRRDVMRIYRRRETRAEGRSLVSQVLARWEQDRRFTGRNGKPRVLSADGPESEFKRLVQSVSSDLNAGTVLFELERIGAVERTRSGLRLLTRAYVPRGDVQAGLALLAADAADLMNAVEENVSQSSESPNLHAKTEYDRIPAGRAAEVRAWFLKEGTRLHERARRFLSRLDLDTEGAKEHDGPTVRAALGTFGLVEPSDGGEKNS